jgi:hypothetical protein
VIEQDQSDMVSKRRAIGGIAIVIAALAVSVSVNILQWRAAGPQLDVNNLSIVREPGQPLRLRIDYRNVGAQPTRWLEIDVVNVVPEYLSVEPSSKSVMANPIPPGISKTLTVPVNSAPKAVAICARWLDRYNTMSTWHWYFSLGKDGNGTGSYVEPAPDYFAAIDRLNPCRPLN